MDILVRIFQTLIEEMHGFTGDYGIAIVLVTVMIRLLLIPLNVRGRRQMEKQQELGRAVEEIKVRYRNNEKKQNEFVIPSGVGLYYLVSGLFSAGEQFVLNAMAVRRAQTHGA